MKFKSFVSPIALFASKVSPGPRFPGSHGLIIREAASKDTTPRTGQLGQDLWDSHMDSPWS